MTMDHLKVVKQIKVKIKLKGCRVNRVTLIVKYHSFTEIE